MGCSIIVEKCDTVAFSVARCRHWVMSQGSCCEFRVFMQGQVSIPALKNVQDADGQWPSLRIAIIIL